MQPYLSLKKAETFSYPINFPHKVVLSIIKNKTKLKKLVELLCDVANVTYLVALH